MSKHWKAFGTTLVALLLANTAQGQVSFSQPPTYAGSGQLFVADFNGGGKPGILAADGTLNLGNGDGTFKTGTAVTGTPLAVADFNGDGKPDVLEQGTGTLLVLLGNGDGTFQAPISTNSGASLTAVAAIDLNGDGKADVVGIFNNTLRVYLANGDGTFAAGVSYSLGVQIGPPTLIVFGDFNGDHKTDVAVLSAASAEQEIVLLGNGDGTFQSSPLTSTGAAALTSAVVGDFNGDGKLDLATLGGSTQAATVFLQLGNGDGTFKPPTTAITGPYSGVGSTGAESTNLAAADVNGDGKLDLVLAADVIGIYLGNGDGTFSNTPTYYQPMSPGINAGIAIADFNSDGKPDVAVDGEILLGSGNGKFQGPPTVLLPSYMGTAVVVGEFVANGAPGVAAIPAIAPGNSNLYVWTNDGTGILSLAHTYTLPQPGYAIATGDLNGDGNLDLVVEGADPVSQNWSYIVLLGNGDGSFRTPVLYQQSAKSTNLLSPIVIADFNNDHKLDLAVTEGKDEFAVLLGNGDGTFGSPAYVFDGDGGPIVSADFNGDANLDIAEAGPSGLAILLGNGDGTFQAAGFPYTSSLSNGLFATDLNNDGKTDLIGNSLAGIQVFLGNANGIFDALTPFNPSQLFVPNVVALADVNGDGKVDVITEGGFANQVTNGIYLGNGDGTFDSSEIPIPYNYPPHSLSPVVQATDMNGDGKADLVIESQSTLFVLLNSTKTKATPPDFTIAPASGSPTSQTISAGQKATFSISLAAVGGFSGSASLTCSISPTVTPPPTCGLSSSPVQIGSTAQTVTVTVGTIGSTASRVSPIGFPPAAPPLAWLAFMLGSGWLFLRNRKRLPSLVAPLIVLAFASLVGCGGSGSSSHMTVGTPSGTYSATITATSGNLSHNMTLTVMVQ
jgi:hypothetical protein